MDLKLFMKKEEELITLTLQLPNDRLYIIKDINSIYRKRLDNIGKRIDKVKQTYYGRIFFTYGYKKSALIFLELEDDAYSIIV